jgi:predicted transcriptional regulator
MMTEYGHEFEEALGTGRMAVSERTMAPPFGLVVADGTSGGRMSLVAYSDTGVYGLISTTEAVAVQWARDLFAEHRGASTKLTPGVRPPAHNN